MWRTSLQGDENIPVFTSAMAAQAYEYTNSSYVYSLNESASCYVNYTAIMVFAIWLILFAMSCFLIGKERNCWFVIL